MIYNHSDTSHTVYDIAVPLYWDEESLNREIDRVFDICLGCRLCFNLCPSFPALFSAVDSYGEQKRLEAVKAGVVSETGTEEWEMGGEGGEHAAEASIEAEFRGEVEDLSESERWKVIDLCYQCRLCEAVCPYTPSDEHEFQLDFPALMIRSQAVRTRERGVPVADRLLANTDLSGRIGSLTAPVANFFNSVKFLRYLMQAVAGIHNDRMLPRYHFQTFEKWLRNRSEEQIARSDSAEKVAIFGTCFTNYNDPEVGRAAARVLEHNDVEVAFPKQQCCGAPHLSPGDFNGFEKQALPNVEELSDWVDRGYKIVVTGPPTCSLTLRRDYGNFVGKNDVRANGSSPEDGSSLASKIQKVSKNTFDISEYLMDLHKQGKLKTDFREEIGAVNYHMSCHLKAQSMGFKSRDLLRLVPNTKIRMVNKCSGMDGGWGMKRECFSASMEMGRKLVAELESKSGDQCCSDCTLAGLQICQASDGRLKSEHPVVLLQKAYGLAD